MIAVLLIGGSCGPALTGALTSRLASLVPEPSLPRAFGLDSLGYNIAGIGRAGARRPARRLRQPGRRDARARRRRRLRCRGARHPARRAPGARGRPARRCARGSSALARDRVLARRDRGERPGPARPRCAPGRRRRGRRPGAGPRGDRMAADRGGGRRAGSDRSPGHGGHAPGAHAPDLVDGHALVGSEDLPLGLAAGRTSALDHSRGCSPCPGCSSVLSRARFHRPPGSRAGGGRRAQVFTLGAGLKTTAAAAGAALGGTIARAPTATQLLIVAACPVLAGALGALLLSTPRRTRMRARASEDAMSARG